MIKRIKRFFKELFEKKYYCHICGGITDEEYVCERCEQHYCENCTAPMSYHNITDYNCCEICGEGWDR